MRIVLAFLTFIVSASLPSLAQAEGRNGITVGVGTLGAEITYTRNLNSFFDVVLGYSSLDYDDSFSDDDNNTFDAEATISAPRIGLQFYPLSFLNMEIGFVSGAPDLKTDFRPDGSSVIDINGFDYPTSQIGYLKGDVSFENDTAPYVLLGIGRSVGGGLGFNLSLGAVQYGAPTTDLSTEGCIISDALTAASCLTLAANVEIEEIQVNNDLEAFELWPFVRLGLTYSF